MNVHPSFSSLLHPSPVCLCSSHHTSLSPFSRLSLHHSLSAVQWCCPASQTTPTPPSFPPDAINTQHRWVIAQTYWLPLLPSCPSPPPSLLPSLITGPHTFSHLHVSPCMVLTQLSQPGPALRMEQPPKVSLTRHTYPCLRATGEHSRPKSRAARSLTFQLGDGKWRQSSSWTPPPGKRQFHRLIWTNSLLVSPSSPSVSVLCSHHPPLQG